ncbi:hypothetical protein GOL98_00095 [Streptomyces sp. Z38]|nr:hypothetical protein [Streptomyces sp. Z38]
MPWWAFARFPAPLGGVTVAGRVRRRGGRSRSSPRPFQGDGGTASSGARGTARSASAGRQ